MQDYVCMVPRNLNKPDTIIHKPFKLNWKQIGYIGLGVGGAYMASQTMFPLIIKIGMIVSSCGLGVVGASFKYKGLTIDELAADSLTYLQRKVYYNNLEKGGGFVVTIKPKQEETTIPIKSKQISISTPA